MIHEFITSHAVLTAQHREALRKKRGFSDDTIKLHRFFSGGKYLLEIEQETIKSFSEELCISSGIFINNGKTLTLSPQLLDDRIIIPYLNEERKAYFLRPHKLGISGAGIEIYKPICEFGKHIILTEGEFKAVAAVQFGFPAIAIPGIGSFSDSHFPRLVSVLQGVRDVCIIFDNEVKDNPKYRNYKQNPSDRYDTTYYAYYMAKILEKEGYRVQIGLLPDSWMKDGKVDLDGALAQGRTKEDISGVVVNSKTPKEFISDQTKEVQSIIQRKLKRKYFRSHIHVEFGKYVATRHRGKQEWDDVISNFTLKIIATHETPTGMIREVQFTNEYGESTSCSAIVPEDMGGADGFTAFCYARGNFIWRGNKEDLANIWEMLFLDDDGRHIIEPDCIGWIESEKLWLFGNIAIKDGKELRPDSNHIFWMERKGIKPVPLGISSGKMQISEGIPYLSLLTCNINEIREKLSETIGEIEAQKCLGWVSAVPFMEELFATYGCFPFLFITGRTGSGKSTVAEWMNCFFGIEDAGKTISQTTIVAIQRALSYYSSLPVFLDEFRNTSDIVYKTGFLRNVYNRQSSGKGIKADFGIREAKVRGTVIIAGEETPNDNAILNRSILIEIMKKNRVINHYDWFMRNRNKFSAHTLNLIKQKAEKSKVESFMRIVQEGRDHLVNKAGVDDRTAINHAIVAAGYAAVFGEQDLSFSRMIVEEAKKTNVEYQRDNILHTFLSDLQVLVHRGDIKDQYWLLEDDRVYLYFEGLYNIWSADARKRGIDPFKASSVRGYFKEEPGFLEIGCRKKISGYARTCIVMDFNGCGQEIRDLVDGKDTVQVQPEP